MSRREDLVADFEVETLLAGSRGKDLTSGSRYKDLANNLHAQPYGPQKDNELGPLPQQVDNLILIVINYIKGK